MRLAAEFVSVEEFLAAHEQEIAHGGLLVRGATLPSGTPLGDCTVSVEIAGGKPVEVAARLAAVSEQGVMVLLPDHAVLDALAARLRAPVLPGRDKLTLQEKMQLALTGDREQRLAMLRDVNKALHPLVLKNSRLALEEVQWAARSPQLNPEALKLIAEHPEWSQNAQVATALVKNPKTPVPLALKLIQRLPVSEVRLLARSQGKPQLVQAAKKRLLEPH